MKKIKKILSSLILCAAIVLAPSLLIAPKVQAAADVVLTFNPSATTVAQNGTFSVDVMVAPGSHQVSNADLALTYPSSLVLNSITNVGSPFSLVQGSTIGSGTAVYSAGTANGSNVTLANISPATTTLYARLNFTAPSSGGTYSLAVANGTAFYADDVPGEDQLSSTNVSTAITVTAPDAAAPSITAFTLPASPVSATFAISSFTATDNTAVTAWMIRETATNVAPTAPISSDSGWQTVGITGTTSASIASNVVGSTPGTRYFWAYAKDAAGNVSAVSTVQTVDVPDTIPPVLSAISPTGTLAVGTTSTPITFTTENAVCSYAATSDIAFASMTDIIDSVATTSHSFNVTGLTNGITYQYWVRCQDVLGNVNTSSTLISFSVSSPAVVVTTPVKSTSSSSSHHSSKKKKTPARSISVSKKTIKFGAILTQRGKKFSKNAFVLLYFAKPGGGYYAPQKIKTSASGSFVVTYKVNKPKGKYGWYALDTKTGKKSKNSYYSVK